MNVKGFFSTCRSVLDNYLPVLLCFLPAGICLFIEVLHLTNPFILMFYVIVGSIGVLASFALTILLIWFYLDDLKQSNLKKTPRATLAVKWGLFLLTLLVLGRLADVEIMALRNIRSADFYHHVVEVQSGEQIPGTDLFYSYTITKDDLQGQPLVEGKLSNGQRLSFVRSDWGGFAWAYFNSTNLANSDPHISLELCEVGNEPLRDGKSQEKIRLRVNFWDYSFGEQIFLGYTNPRVSIVREIFTLCY